MVRNRNGKIIEMKLIQTLAAVAVVIAPIGAFGQTSGYVTEQPAMAPRSGDTVTVRPDEGRGSSEFFNGESRGEQRPTQGSEAPGNDRLGPNRGPSAGAQE